MQHLDFTATLATLSPEGEGFTAVLAPNWAQGRAGFGGLVAALGMDAVRRRSGLDWPLRSLSVSFIGPAVGLLSIGVETHRVGRTAAFLTATIRLDGATVATVSACLGPDRESRIRHDPAAGPRVPPPDACPAVPMIDGVTPTFLRNLDVRMVQGTVFSGGAEPEVLWWVRHRDAAAQGTEAGLVALLDTLPPAAAGVMRGPAPLSSLTWMVDFPSGDVGTDDGWYLLRSRADYAGAGFSGQVMEAWARDGRLVALHRQSVAIFA